MPATKSGLRYFRKGSPEAKAHMARLRAMQRRGPRKSRNPLTSAEYDRIHAEAGRRYAAAEKLQGIPSAHYLLSGSAQGMKEVANKYYDYGQNPRCNPASCRNPRHRHRRYSRPAQRAISTKIGKLVREGYPQKQAIAIAHSMARRAGYKVPAANPGYRVIHLGPTGAGTDSAHETLAAAIARAKELEKVAHQKGYYEQYIVYGPYGREMYRSTVPPHGRANPRRSRPVPPEFVEIQQWFERDRASVVASDKRTDKTIAEWWDEEVDDMVEGGFFRGGRIPGSGIDESSVLEYLQSVGLVSRHPFNNPRRSSRVQWHVYKDGRPVGRPFSSEAEAGKFISRERSGGQLGQAETWRVYPTGHPAVRNPTVAFQGDPGKPLVSYWGGSKRTTFSTPGGIYVTPAKGKYAGTLQIKPYYEDAPQRGVLATSALVSGNPEENPRLQHMAVVKAFFKGRRRKIGPRYQTDGESLWMHGNLVAEKVPLGIRITNAGWATATTKALLNEVLAQAPNYGYEGGHIQQEAFQWYLDGKPFPGEAYLRSWRAAPPAVGGPAVTMNPWWYGYGQGSGGRHIETFYSKKKPTEASHGRRYAAVVGPFQTSGSAQREHMRYGVGEVFERRRGKSRKVARWEGWRWVEPNPRSRGRFKVGQVYHGFYVIGSPMGQWFVMRGTDRARPTIDPVVSVKSSRADAEDELAWRVEQESGIRVNAYSKDQERDLEYQRAQALPGPEGMKTWDAYWRSPKAQQPALLEVPLGELVDNWALAMIHKRRGGWLEDITGKERFNAQGLEGKAVIPLTYYEALTHSQFIKPYRFRIVTGKAAQRRGMPNPAILYRDRKGVGQIATTEETARIDRLHGGPIVIEPWAYGVPLPRVAATHASVYDLKKKPYPKFGTIPDQWRPGAYDNPLTKTESVRTLRRARQALTEARASRSPVFGAFTAGVAYGEAGTVGRYGPGKAKRIGWDISNRANEFVSGIRDNPILQTVMLANPPPSGPWVVYDWAAKQVASKRTSSYARAQKLADEMMAQEGFPRTSGGALPKYTVVSLRSARAGFRNPPRRRFVIRDTRSGQDLGTAPTIEAAHRMMTKWAARYPIGALTVYEEGSFAPPVGRSNPARRQEGIWAVNVEYRDPETGAIKRDRLFISARSGAQARELALATLEHDYGALGRVTSVRRLGGRSNPITPADQLMVEMLRDVGPLRKGLGYFARVKHGGMDGYISVFNGEDDEWVEVLASDVRLREVPVRYKHFHGKRPDRMERRPSTRMAYFGRGVLGAYSWTRLDSEMHEHGMRYRVDVGRGKGDPKYFQTLDQARAFQRQAGPDWYIGAIEPPKSQQNPLTRTERRELTRSGIESLRAARAIPSHRQFYGGRASARFDVAREYSKPEYDEAQRIASLGRKAFQYYRGNPPAKPPFREGQKIPVAKARAWVVSTGNKELLKQFDDAQKLQAKANRQAKYVVWRTIPMGSPNKLDSVMATVQYGTTKETYYTAPKGSKKGPHVYRHKWEKKAVPILASADGKALVMPLGEGQTATDWLRG